MITALVSLKMPEEPFKTSTRKSPQLLIAVDIFQIYVRYFRFEIQNFPLKIDLLYNYMYVPEKG